MLRINELSGDKFSIELQEPREADDEIRFLDFLNRVTDKERFGLLLSVDGDKSFSPEAKRLLNIWFKTNRATLNERCFGFARVSPDATHESAFNSAALRQAMPCPYCVVQSKEEALSWLDRAFQAPVDATIEHDQHPS